MSESIGNLYSTQIPSLSEVADIQEALRLYHYGAPSGTGIGQYDPTNTNPSNLINPSIAFTLNSLQSQITSISGSVGVQASTWNAKGELVTATAPSTVIAIAPGTNGQILTANSATATGLQWSSPEVTLVNTVTLSNKTLTAPRISSTSSINDANGNRLISFPTLLTSPVNEISITNAETGLKPTISASGLDSNITLNLVSKGSGTVQVNGVNIVGTTLTQTLTNKTLTAPTLSQAYVVDNITFEGISSDDFETTLGALDPTADRSINLPNASGTIITTGNLTSIVSTGTVTNGTWNATTISTLYGGTGLTSYATGDVIYSSSTNTLSKLGIGSTGQVLTVSGGVPVWQNIPSGFANPMTTTGDIIYSSSGSTPARLGIGSAGQVLTVSGGVPVWQTPSSGFANPMTTIGDIIYGGSGGTGTRLAGNTSTTASFLRSTGDGANSSAPAWQASTGTGNVVLATSPALAGTPTAPTAADGTNTTQIATTAYAYQLEDFIVIALSDETTNITTGTAKLTWRAPFAMTITRIPRASLSTASSSGNPTVDINENGVSILGANKLSINAGSKTSVGASTPTTVTDTAIADDSEITFDIDVAGTGARGLKVTLYYKRA